MADRFSNLSCSKCGAKLEAGQDMETAGCRHCTTEAAARVAKDDDVTAILARWNAGDRAALEQLITVLYSELRKLAASHMRREDAASTIAVTGLVHEVYLQFVDQRRVQFNNRSHFFGAAAQIMRRILVDHAREKHALKRGGHSERLTLTAAFGVEAPQHPDILDLNDALAELEKFDAQKARVVELRYFADLSVAEVAEVLALSTATVKREWSIARAWLYDRLNAPRPRE